MRETDSIPMEGKVLRSCSADRQLRYVSSVLLIVFLSYSPLPSYADDKVQFSRQVLPLLADRCFHCHGPDDGPREAELRLDEQASAFADRGGYAVIVPGDSEASELIHRITTHDESLQMPPPDSFRKPLKPDEVETLKRWIEEGATWGKHWSLERPIRPAVPQVDGVSSPVDAFIRQRLREVGLPASRRANRRVLIRRVTLDLTGLPPTLDEINAFLADESTDAYEKVVDRLLKSPRYGQRMAWPWLDASRYADTGGYQGDPIRTMWPWRDWVVRALNDNMPFDQFTIEQIAGDLLPNATIEQRLATGFNRNHMHNSEGGRIAEETRVENVFDRVETTGTVWLGLTLQCARCHDHKFDPISNKDYFAFYDFFNQTSEDGRTDRSAAVPPAIDYLPTPIGQEVATLDERLRAIDEQFSTPDDSIAIALRNWDRDVTEQIAKHWKTLHPERAEARAGTTLRAREDGSIHATGNRPDQETYTISSTLPPQTLAAIRLEAFVDPESPAASTGRDGKGNFVLSELELFSRSIDQPNAPLRELSFKNAFADYTQNGFSIRQTIDGIENANEGWAVDGHRCKEPRRAIFVLQEPLTSTTPFELVIRLRFESVHQQHTLALFRLSTRNAIAFDEKDFPVICALDKEEDARSSEEKTLLREHFLVTRSEQYRVLAEERARAVQRRNDLQRESKPVPVMVMDTRQEPRDTFVLVKGVYNDVTNQRITADIPDVFPALPREFEGQRFNRLDLARWIVSPENPLTARVAVNRYWQLFFGQGIVSTPGDFGVQGAQPTHPELLDWLAVEFVESGWNVKAMHRLIVLSETYQQSSSVSPELLSIDPANALLARAPRFRMPSWMLRDQALAVSGLLVETSGGEPVKPYQPAGVWAEATFGKQRYQIDSGNRLYRRSLYTFWRRIIGPTVFFDSAKRQTCEVRPNRTNTPLHALTTLNDVTYVEAARVLAEHLLSEPQSHSKRIERGFEILTARPPRAKELALLERRLAQYIDHFHVHKQAAIQLVSVGESDLDNSLEVAELAAYATLLNTLLNLDEVLVRP